MSIEERLEQAALRILSDGRRHEQSAIAWAKGLLSKWREPTDLARMGFSTREISLGAQPW